MLSDSEASPPHPTETLRSLSLPHIVPMIFGRVTFNYLLGLIHLPPVTRDNKMKTMATHEKAVLSVARPMVRKARPSTRKTVEEFLRFMGEIILLRIMVQP